MSRKLLPLIILCLLVSNPPYAAPHDGEDHLAFAPQEMTHPFKSHTKPLYHYLVNQSSAIGTGFVIDLEGKPHLFYYSPNLAAQRLNHSFWNGIDWNHEVIADAAVYHNCGPRAVVDSMGRVHVVFFNQEYQLGYALYDGAWNVEVVDRTTDTGDWCDIVLDDQDIPRVAYSKNGTWRTRYAWKDGFDWRMEEIPGAGGYGANLELDSKGFPHISDSSNVIRYSYKDESGWHSETVTTLSGSFYNSLTLDRQDRPQVAFYCTVGGYNLQYATKNSGTWKVHMVDSGIQQSKKGWDNHIHCDEQGILHIAYFAHNQLEIRHAWGSGSS